MFLRRRVVVVVPPLLRRRVSGFLRAASFPLLGMVIVHRFHSMCLISANAAASKEQPKKETSLPWDMPILPLPSDAEAPKDVATAIAWMKQMNNRSKSITDAIVVLCNMDAANVDKQKVKEFSICMRKEIRAQDHSINRHGPFLFKLFGELQPSANDTKKDRDMREEYANCLRELEHRTVNELAPQFEVMRAVNGTFSYCVDIVKGFWNKDL